MILELFHGPASPFVRKVMVVAHVLGVQDQIRLHDSAASPVDRDRRVREFNPLAKIPAARCPDGTLLYDSRVICEYLDHVAGGGVFPAAGTARWTALRRQALADGLLDAALLMRYERVLRPVALQWPVWLDKQQDKVLDALDAMQADRPGSDCADIGAIACACALGYLDLRFPEIDWRTPRPELAEWFSLVSQRPALSATVPRG